MRFHPLHAALAGALLFAQVAVAQQHPNLDAKAILRQQQDIRAEANTGKGRYKDMKPETRQELFSRQDQVVRLIGDAARTTDLPETEQVALVNALESIEAILNDAEDERLVCERVQRVGSHRTQTFCQTVADRRIEQALSERQIDERDQQCVQNVEGECL